MKDNDKEFRAVLETVRNDAHQDRKKREEIPRHDEEWDERTAIETRRLALAPIASILADIAISLRIIAKREVPDTREVDS